MKKPRKYVLDVHSVLAAKSIFGLTVMVGFPCISASTVDMLAPTSLKSKKTYPRAKNSFCYTIHDENGWM